MLHIIPGTKEIPAQTYTDLKQTFKFKYNCPKTKMAPEAHVLALTTKPQHSLICKSSVLHFGGGFCFDKNNKIVTAVSKYKYIPNGT